MSSSHPTSSRRAPISLTADDYEYLHSLTINHEQNERQARRARFILALAHGMSVTDAARLAGFSRPVAYRWLDRIQLLGLRAGLADKPYQVHDRSPEACNWILSLAREPANPSGVMGEPWTLDSLAQYVRAFASRVGHPELARITSGGVHRILESAGVKLNGEEQR
jgi:transposase